MIIELVLLVVLLLVLLYRWITKSFDKWARLGVPHDKPSFPYGTHNFLTGKKHMNDFVTEDYRKFKQEQSQKVHGWFLFGKPTLAINDVDLIKQIQVKDFNHFVDRNEVNLGKSFARGGKLDQIWGKSLDNVAGDQWKKIRTTFTPIFTSGKMKIMLKFITETSKHLTNEFAENAKEGEEIDLKDAFGKFSLDALASSAFGVDAQSFTNEKSVFVKQAAEVFKQTGMDMFAFLVKLIPGVPTFLEVFNINLFKPGTTKYFRDMVLKTMEVRRKSKVRRNDLIDLMLDCLKEDSKDSEESSNQFDKDQKLNHRSVERVTDDEVVATAMVFLIAGYDTTGMTLSFFAYAMSKNPEVQERLQAEVDQAFEDNDGELPEYTAIQGLPYLDMVLMETLRMYSPVHQNSRSCTQDYTLPGTDITLRKGDFINWSIRGLHEDPQHFSHPKQFWPEHFSKEEKASRNPYAFQAFGQGPRACIGMRFALLEAKVAILMTLRRFSFTPGTRTQEPLVTDPESALGFPKGSLWAKVVQREGLY